MQRVLTEVNRSQVAGDYGAKRFSELSSLGIKPVLVDSGSSMDPVGANVSYSIVAVEVAHLVQSYWVAELSPAKNHTFLHAVLTPALQTLLLEQRPLHCLRNWWSFAAYFPCQYLVAVFSEVLDHTGNCAIWLLEGGSDLFDGADRVSSGYHLPEPSKNNGFLFELGQVAIAAPTNKLNVV